MKGIKIEVKRQKSKVRSQKESTENKDNYSFPCAFLTHDLNCGQAKSTTRHQNDVSTFNEVTSHPQLLPTINLKRNKLKWIPRTSIVPEFEM
jgi:hypothetical protein